MIEIKHGDENGAGLSTRVEVEGFLLYSLKRCVKRILSRKDKTFVWAGEVTSCMHSWRSKDAKDDHRHSRDGHCWGYVGDSWIKMKMEDACQKIRIFLYFYFDLKIHYIIEKKRAEDLFRKKYIRGDSKKPLLRLKSKPMSKQVTRYIMVNI